jgi:plastocyanin
MKLSMAAALGAALWAAALVAVAAEYEVPQKNKQFTVRSLKIKTGDTVSFPNQDVFFHNVFSLSQPKTFDLGSYPKGDTRKVVFDKAGKVEVECAVHPHMRMMIDVQE